MTKFEQLLENRRPASNFPDAAPITKNELNDIFSLVKLGPSAFNLQYTKYITVMDPAMKEKVRAAAYGQYQVLQPLLLCLEINKLISRQPAFMKV